MVQSSEKKESKLMDDNKNNTDCNDKDDIYIDHNTLITLNYGRGKESPLSNAEVFIYSPKITTSGWYNNKNILEEGVR